MKRGKLSLPTLARGARIVGVSIVVAWLIAASAVIAGTWLAFLDTPRGGDLPAALRVGLRGVFTVLAFPATMSNWLLGMSGVPPHSPEDVISEICAYTHGTFLVVLVITVVSLPLTSQIKKRFAGW